MLDPAQLQAVVAIGALIAVPLLLAWLGLVVQCANATFKSDGDKVAWVLVLILLGPLGGVLYLIGGRARQTTAGSRDKWVV